MSKRYFSPDNLEFFAAELRERYIKSGTWPDDAVEITDNEWQTYGASNAPEGKQLGAGTKGRPCWVKEGADKVWIRRQDALNQIDATADRVRASDRSVGRHLDVEYQLVAQALADYRAHPDGEVPEAIHSYASVEGITIQDAAQQIAEAAARTENLLQSVRRIRLAGKAAVRAERDDSNFHFVAQLYIDQLLSEQM